MGGMMIAMIILPIALFGVFAYLIFSGKMHKMMFKGLSKGMNEGLKAAEEDLTEINKTSGRIKAKSEKAILDENEDIMKENVSRQSDIEAVGIEKKTRAVRKGLLEDEEESEGIFCKECGKKIAKDSKFCKYCGSKQ